MSRSPALGRSPVAALIAALAVLLVAGPAGAQESYRYWTYWWGAEGSWEYATSGAADRTITDGSVEGWLLQVSADPVPSAQPATQPDFATLCPDAAQPEDGTVRVAVVIDYGSDSDAPAGQAPPEGPDVSCLNLPEGSNGDQALAAAADVRLEGGATCGVNGYPSTGCFDAVPVTAGTAAPSPAGTAEEGSEDADDAEGGNPILLSLAGLAALLAVGGFFIARSRKTD